VRVAECLFCRIASGAVPAKLVHEDAEVVAFEDIDPQAPVHLLVVPRKHLPTLNDVGPAEEGLVGKLFGVAAALARARGIDASGWRAVVNTNRDAHQLVFHVHLHVLGGREMRWPPG
jgi:histidine triad (HIT) family protein